jgi:hypothetical protein
MQKKTIKHINNFLKKFGGHNARAFGRLFNYFHLSNALPHFIILRGRTGRVFIGDPPATIQSAPCFPICLRRKHLVRAVLAIVVLTALSFLFVQQIMGYLAMPMEGGISELIAIDPTENIGTVMRVTHSRLR